MKILLVALAAMAAQAGGPTVAQFEAALAAACPDQPTRTRNVACTRPDQASIQYSCAYEMQGEDGRWAPNTAILQQAEGEWVWIDGPTRCSGEEEPEFN